MEETLCLPESQVAVQNPPRHPTSCNIRLFQTVVWKLHKTPHAGGTNNTGFNPFATRSWKLGSTHAALFLVCR
jgi:hypothetical protein